MSAGTTTVEFTAIDLYEKMLEEARTDPARYRVKYSPVARDAAEGYRLARERAVERTKAKGLKL